MGVIVGLQVDRMRNMVERYRPKLEAASATDVGVDTTDTYCIPLVLLFLNGTPTVHYTSRCTIVAAVKLKAYRYILYRCILVLRLLN